MRLEDLTETILVAAKPFFAQGHDHVVVALHCERLFVGVVTPAACGSCGSSVEVQYGTLTENEDLTLSKQKP